MMMNTMHPIEDIMLSEISFFFIIFICIKQIMMIYMQIIISIDINVICLFDRNVIETM